jgi:chemotaxis protein MotA
MKFLVGLFVVLGCVLFGYVGNDGHLPVLWQPFEFIIILGAAVGAFIIANPAAVVKRTMGNVKRIMSGPTYHKKDYVQLLCLLFCVFKLAKSKGMLSLEAHIENPQESTIFQRFPSFLKNHMAMNFLCDYLRLLTMGSENVYQMDDLMMEEIEGIQHEDHCDVQAMEKMADGTPALGIVAAVLGVIHTMGSISQPPEVLGHLIGGALVGTFAGVLISYGIVGPMSQSLAGVIAADQKYIMCIKSSIIAYLNGCAPIIIVEFARKSLEEEQRPSFNEIEVATQQLGDV